MPGISGIGFNARACGSSNWPRGDPQRAGCEGMTCRPQGSRTPPSPSPRRGCESRGPAQAPQALGSTGPAPQKRRRPPGAAHSASALRLGSTSLGWREPSCHSPLSVRAGLREPGVRAQLQAGEKVWARPMSLEAPPPQGYSDPRPHPRARRALSRVWLPFRGGPPRHLAELSCRPARGEPHASGGDCSLLYSEPGVPPGPRASTPRPRRCSQLRVLDMPPLLVCAPLEETPVPGSRPGLLLKST